MISIAQLSRLAAMAQSAENQDMRWAGIFAPDFGEREDIPYILLPEAFTAENKNVLLINGAIQRMQMRMPELTEAQFTLGTVTATNGSATLTVSGGAGTWGSSATHKPAWGSDQATAGRTIKITDGGLEYSYTIKNVADNGATLTLTANYAQTGGAGLTYKIGTAGEKVKTPDGYAIMRYHRLVKSTDGTEYLMVFTKAHAYLWVSSWSAFVLKFTCGSDASTWSSIDFNNQIIASNNVDKIQVWGGTIANAFAVLSNASGCDTGGGSYLTKAKYLWSYQGYLIAADVTIGGSHYPFQFNWCSRRNEADWDQTGSGDAGADTIIEGGRFRGFGEYGGFLVIAKETRMYRCWLVTTEEVFNTEVELTNIGCISADTLINDREGRLYWLANDYTIREWRSGIISQPKQTTVKEINPGLAEGAKAGFIDVFNQIWFSIPQGPDITGNTVVLTYDPPVAGLDMSNGKWGELDIAVSAFGDYTRQSRYTWDTLPFDTWEEWGWQGWDGAENEIGFPLDLGSDYDGYTYDMHSAELDDGEEYEGYVVISTDLLIQQMIKRYGNALSDYKRIEAAKLFFRRETAGELALALKADNKPAWQSAGSVSLADETEQKDIIESEINGFDIRGKHFLCKISASSRFRLIGVMLGFTADGRY